MTNLLTIIVFLENVANIIPHSSISVARISKITKTNMIFFYLKISFFWFIGIYFIANSILCMFSLVGNIYVLHIHNKDPRICKDMSYLVNKLIFNHTFKYLKK